MSQTKESLLQSIDNCSKALKSMSETLYSLSADVDGMYLKVKKNPEEINTEKSITVIENIEGMCTNINGKVELIITKIGDVK